MSQIFVHANVTINGIERKTSGKGNEYLKVTVKDEFKNVTSLCDMNTDNQPLYEEHKKGELIIKITSGRKYNGDSYTSMSIEDFAPENSKNGK